MLVQEKTIIFAWLTILAKTIFTQQNILFA
jgi:hypothetical protein